MDFHSMTRDQLRKLAAEAEIPGRSKMNKAELAEALEYTGIGESETDQRPAGHDDPLYIAPGHALVDRTKPGEATALISEATLHEADAPAARLVRDGRRWKLVDDYGDETITVRAGTIAKAVKAWAKRLGIMLDGIETVKQF